MNQEARKLGREERREERRRERRKEGRRAHLPAELDGGLFHHFSLGSIVGINCP